MAETTVRIELDVAPEYRPLRMAGGKGDTPAEKTAQEAKDNFSVADLPYIRQFVSAGKNISSSIETAAGASSFLGGVVGGVGMAMAAYNLAKLAMNTAINFYDILGLYEFRKGRAEAQYLRNRSGNAYYRRGQ